MFASHNQVSRLRSAVFLKKILLYEGWIEALEQGEREKTKEKNEQNLFSLLKVKTLFDQVCEPCH